ncbi:hypothetical protein NL676_029779 [Syzygium grande]|nr:hypothetical protein NL676_029779 [Syzygium grande]
MQISVRRVTEERFDPAYSIGTVYYWPKNPTDPTDQNPCQSSRTTCTGPPRLLHHMCLQLLAGTSHRNSGSNPRTPRTRRSQKTGVTRTNSASPLTTLQGEVVVEGGRPKLIVRSL